MDVNKLYSTVDAGFRSALRGALVSKIYPITDINMMSVSSISLSIADMREVLVNGDSADQMTLSAIGISKGVLESFGIPPEGYPVGEEGVVSAVTLVGGELRNLVVEPVPILEPMLASPIVISAGTLVNVLVQSSTDEVTNVSSITVSSGTLV